MNSLCSFSFQHCELEEASCIKAIAPVHCFSAFWSARIKVLLLGLSGVDVFLGWNTLGEAIMTLGRFMLVMSCSLLLVRASRSQRRLGFSGRTGVSGSAKNPLEPFAVSFMTFSRLESKVLLRWHSWSKDSYPDDMSRRGVDLVGLVMMDLFLLLFDLGDHWRGVQPNEEGSTASQSFL